MCAICFVRVGATPLFLNKSEGEFGGAEVRAFTFAQELARRGHPVSFGVAPHPDLVEQTDAGIRVIALPQRVRGFRKILRSLRGRWNSVPQSFPAIKKLKAPVLACFGIHQPTPEVIAAARATGKKTLLFLTSIEDVLPGGGPSGRQKRVRILHDYAIRFADQVMVQTEAQLEQLQKNYRRTGTLLRNPIDTRIHDDELLEYRSHVLWVGRADTDSKRADLCLELARQSPQTPFRMVINGGREELLKEWMETKPSNVTIDTFVPLSEVERLYRTAAVLVNTSVSEGFPNAFLQAMKYRTPILSLCVDPDSVLARYNCGEVAGSVTQMTERLQDYWPRGAECVAKGTNGRQYVVEHHELSSCVDDLEAVLQGLTAANRAVA